jgi:hypothetical protein
MPAFHLGRDCRSHGERNARQKAGGMRFGAAYIGVSHRYLHFDISTTIDN